MWVRDVQDINYKIERVNLYESVANNIEQVILTDSAQIGQKLPSEQALAHNFGVSRNVIREALKLLKERQLVNVHTGEGAYIVKPNKYGVARMLNRIILMDNIDEESVFEMREMLEVNAVCLAAKRNSVESFDALTQINEKMVANKNDVEARIKNDLEFHQKIAELSHNALLELFIKSMNSLLTPILRTALIPEGGNEDGIKVHGEIIKALRSQDETRSAQIMSEHLHRSTENYLNGHLLDGGKHERVHPATEGTDIRA